MRLIIYFLLLTLAFTNKTYAITINWDSGGDGTSWTDPLNWDCNCLPGVADAVTIAYGGANVIIPTGSNIHIYRLLSYNTVTIEAGATLRTDFLINLWIDGSFTNNGTINAYGEGMYILDDHQVVNNGTINLEGTDNFISLGFGSTINPAKFTNNGSIVFNSTNLSILEIKSNSVFTNTTSGSITFNYATSLLNVISGSFTNQGSIETKGRIINSSTLVNTNTGNILVHNYTETAISNGGTLQNNGTILVNNPMPAALYCINNSGTISGTGSVSLEGFYNIYNTNTGNITFEGPVQLEGDLHFGGIFNQGNITFDNNSISTINCTVNNQAIGVITIEACKRVIVNANWQNYGLLVNHGTFEINYADITTHNLFTNYGMYVSNLPAPNVSPTGNIGIHLFKVFGQQCAGTEIPDIFTGTGTSLTNTPSGIFTDIGLSTSAGSFDFGTRTFTPNATCHGLSTLYISFQQSGCSPVVFPWQFEFPIYAPTTYYEDTDFDGFGNLASPLLVECAAAPIGYSLFSTDCDENNPDVYPGAPEICNDKDYNCDGMITGTNPAPTWYQDLDNDGYGNALVSIVNCSPLVGFVALGNDCDDNDGFIYPSALEGCNNIDDDCDGHIDEDFPPTTVTFNGSVDSDWFNTANWTPAMVPGYCMDVVIPTGMMVTAGGVGMTATCRSMSIAATSSVSVNDNVQLNITGGTMFGISNAGTLNLNNDSYINVQYINGNGVENSNTLTMTGNAILYISVTSQSSIRNLSGGTITINSNNGLDMNAANENAIYNLGTMHRSGFFNANNITGSTIKNEGVFNNNDNLFINAFGLPGWFVENLYGGIINNNAGQTWTFPIPGSFYNVSDMGLVNHSGATFNNYGTLQFFGHRIAGSGAFVSYAGSAVEGCVPGLGCP